MMRSVDADYYGYMDDDDGLLIPSEEKCEKEAIRKKIEQWKNSETNDVEIDEAFVVPEMNVCLICLLLNCSIRKYPYRYSNKDNK
jgi:hypothetical protein